MYQLRHEIGDVIKDRYTVRAVLGSGAFGTVYRVEEQIGARVVTLACKEMHVLSDPESPSDERGEALRMFQEEAYLLQTLRNPHIPSAYFEMDKGVWLSCPVCGQTFKGTRHCPMHGNELQVIRERFYLIMDFIEGPDLEQLLEQNAENPLPETDVLDWTIQVCEALETVHAAGLSHRDIKPANIKLQRDSNRAMLIDFGLVKPSHATGKFGTMQMGQQAALGTLGYAPESPTEQANPDARTDILALGMTMYRLLTGLDPTEPADLETIRRGPPGGVNLKLSDATSDVVQRAIQVNPDNRYPDVQSMKRDLLAARYPVEVTCPSCGHVQRTLNKPTADMPCARCGRPLGDKAQPAATSSSTQGTQKTAKSSAQPASTQPAAAVKKQTSNNPFEARLVAIGQELESLNAPPQDGSAARIAELESALAAFAGAQNVISARCPACKKADLQKISGAQPTSLCPLCSGSLARTTRDETLCAVCRSGKLQDRVLSETQAFCPVCRTQPLREDRRPQLAGLLSDIWMVCDHCHAEFDQTTLGAKFTLKKAGDDPHGTGAQNLGKTLPIGEWRKISGRTNKGRDCQSCGAQFDTQGDGGVESERLWIAAYRADPYGVGAEYSSRTLTREEWAKIAAGGRPDDGNARCTKCGANWDINRAAQTMRLTGAIGEPPSTPAWAEKMRGQSLPLPVWALAAAGKTSGAPGMICPNCKTEFDTDSGALRLVATAEAQLQPSIGRTMSLQDWQRTAQGGINSVQAQDMRRELNQLMAQTQQAMNSHAMQTRRRREDLEYELVDLLKKSVLKGYIPVQRLSTQAPQNGGAAYVDLRNSGIAFALRQNERLRFETPSSLCSMQLTVFGPAWSVVAEGILAITDERVLFTTGGQRIYWQTDIAGLRGVNLGYVDGVPMLSMGFQGLPDPVSFTAQDVAWDIVFQGRNYRLLFTPDDLVNALNG